ncbi:dihydrolipoamide acetyltransferase family protein [Agromyces sp. NPDC057679]|uniref:dihydrolipoamide acetyltransferase family protein n=1 Tax=Agromyces sp. NPDC057679 TaxID=3346207 RepID=UPI00366F6294
MSREFILPDLGEGLTEAEIVAWLVAPGDEVAIDQPVVELESAKSVVQLPTPFAGVVESLGGEVGETLHAGTVLMTLGSDVAAAASSNTDASAPEPAAAPAPAGAAPAASPVAAEPGVAAPTEVATEESGAVLIGYGTRATTVTKRAATAPARFGRRRTGAATGSGPGAGTSSGGVAAPSRLDSARRSPVVSPIVRRLARQHGFDASQLDGSGPDHLVMRRDVEAFIGEQQAVSEATPQAVVEASAPSTPVPAAVAAPASGDERIPLDRIGRAAAAHFSRSRREIPEATVWMDVDATALVAARKQLHAATGERFGTTALVARFVVAGLRKHPRLNSSFDAERDEVVLHGAVNLGLAAQTPRGLMVPVVHGAEQMSLRGLRDAIGTQTEAAATGVFAPAALSGGTFTLNNYGTLGVDGSAAIINHPEAAMLGIGRLVERPWVVDGALAVRTVTELTLSFDHRVCDGAEAAAFLTFVAGCIEQPLSLLAEL